MSQCCICERNIDREDAPVLSMGAAGVPRLLCEECEALLDTVTESHDFAAVEAAMDKIGKLMADTDPDYVTFNTVNEIMADASERIKAIKDGSYVEASDEDNEDVGLEDIPEELLESEEDKLKDEKEQEQAKKFDKVYTVLVSVLLTLTVLLLTWKLLDTFNPGLTMPIKTFVESNIILPIRNLFAK